MVLKNLKSPRRLVVIAAFAVVAMSVFGFAAANTVDDSNAGDGTGDVSGGDVENIHYTLNSSNEITTVSFNYTADTDAPDNIRITLVGPNVNANCTAGAPPAWSCTLGTAQPITPVTGLRVVSFD